MAPSLFIFTILKSLYFYFPFHSRSYLPYGTSTFPSKCSILLQPHRVNISMMSEKGSRSWSHRALPYTPIRSAASTSQWSLQSLQLSPSPVNSDAFWRTPPKRWRIAFCGSRQFNPPAVVKRHVTSRRLIFIVFVAVVAAMIYFPAYRRSARVSSKDVHALDIDRYQPIRPTLSHSTQAGPDPVLWLKENSDDRYSVLKDNLHLPLLGNGRPRAALISLVRNSELPGMMQSMRQLEYRWNRKYQVSVSTSSFEVQILREYSTHGSSSTMSLLQMNS